MTDIPETIYPGEVFPDTKLFDTGIRQLLPHFDTPRQTRYEDS
jgi:hypothetical protein